MGIVCAVSDHAQSSPAYSEQWPGAALCALITFCVAAHAVGEYALSPLVRGIASEREWAISKLSSMPCRLLFVCAGIVKGAAVAVVFAGPPGFEYHSQFS